MGTDSLQTDSDLVDKDPFENHDLYDIPICPSPVSLPALKMSVLTAVLIAEQEKHHCVSSLVFILGHKIIQCDLDFIYIILYI